MAIIPLKQTAIIRNLISDNNDGWDASEYGPPFTLKCRATETLKTIESSSVTEGLKKTVDEKAKATLVLLFDKLPNINYDSEITFTNELGVTIKRKPTLIQPIRMISGKPTLTEVHL